MRHFLAFAGLLAAVTVASPAAAQNYVIVCEAFGTGYFYDPGTETCIKADDGTTKELEDDLSVTRSSTKLREGIAISFALPDAVVDPGKTVGAAVKIGVYGETVAIGVGVAIRPMDGVTFSGNAAYGLDRRQIGGSAGMNVSW